MSVGFLGYTFICSVKPISSRKPAQQNSGPLHV